MIPYRHLYGYFCQAPLAWGSTEYKGTWRTQYPANAQAVPSLSGEGMLVKWDQTQTNVCACRRNGNRGSILYVEKDLRCCAGCGESVRRVTHGRNCHQRWPEFRVNDSEANNSPRPERARGQEHVGKAGNSRRCVCCGPATPERYGEDWIVCIPLSRGGTAHALAAHLTPTPSRAMGSTFADGTPCVMADAQRGH